MTRNIKNLILYLFIPAFLFSCNKEIPEHKKKSKLALPETPYEYRISNVPEHMNTSNIGFLDNDKATLGRVLFYDKNLSLNNSISCGSCHNQRNGFADPVALSTGLMGKKTKRNSSSIANAINKRSFFWDGRASSLEMQVLMPIENHIEMGMENLYTLPGKLSKLDYYPPLFKNAFNDSDSITLYKISQAMSEFLKSMYCYQSKYDEGVQTDFANYTSYEKLGKDLFEGKLRCNSCHGGHNFLGYGGSANIGLDIFYSDGGLGDIVNKPIKGFGPIIISPNEFDEFDFFNTSDEDKKVRKNGRFMVPGLRNIALTAPYMHDGRLKDLDEVIEHYTKGIKPHPGLDYRLFDNDLEKKFSKMSFGSTISESELNEIKAILSTPVPRKINITETEKKAVIAYLNTLTDYKVISDPKFSDPFVSE